MAIGRKSKVDRLGIASETHRYKTESIIRYMIPLYASLMAIRLQFTGQNEIKINFSI